MTITWKLDVGVPNINFRSWTFDPKGIFAQITTDGEVVNTTQNSPGPFTITKPSTLILKNVNIQYNGTYSFLVVSGVQSTASLVHVFVAGKCNLYNILYLLTQFFTKRFRVIFRHINKLLYSDWFRQLQLTNLPDSFKFCTHDAAVSPNTKKATIKLTVCRGILVFAAIAETVIQIVLKIFSLFFGHFCFVVAYAKIPCEQSLSYFFSAQHGEARETLQNLCINSFEHARRLLSNCLFPRRRFNK